MSGSSPRMRGNSELEIHFYDPIPDHPRACGELIATRVVDRGDRGSSPRMRGTPHGRRGWTERGRIIPAHAGNSDHGGVPERTVMDHPRACGELAFWISPAATTVGSSPRMRGTPVILMTGWRRIRIIPAHAGNSRQRAAVDGWMADHPRACGELNVYGVLLYCC